MERDLDGALIAAIDGMIDGSGLVREPWQHDGPGGGLQFHSYPRRGIEPTCLVRRRQIVGEGTDNPETAHVAFQRSGDGFRLTEESLGNLQHLVADGIAQKLRHDAIIDAGEDPRRPPFWSVTMHRIGLLMLSNEKGRRIMVDIEGRPALQIEGGPPAFPIVKGRVTNSVVHEPTISDGAGSPGLIFRNRLGPGIHIPGIILPETVLQSIVRTRPDVADIVAHPLFGTHTGVAVTDAAVTSEGTHLFLEDVQDDLPPMH